MCLMLVRSLGFMSLVYWGTKCSSQCLSHSNNPQLITPEVDNHAPHIWLITFLVNPIKHLVFFQLFDVLLKGLQVADWREGNTEALCSPLWFDKDNIEKKWKYLNFKSLVELGGGSPLFCVRYKGGYIFCDDQTRVGHPKMKSQNCDFSGPSPPLLYDQSLSIM